MTENRLLQVRACLYHGTPSLDRKCSQFLERISMKILGASLPRSLHLCHLSFRCALLAALDSLLIPSFSAQKTTSSIPKAPGKQEHSDGAEKGVLGQKMSSSPWSHQQPPVQALSEHQSPRPVCSPTTPCELLSCDFGLLKLFLLSGTPFLLMYLAVLNLQTKCTVIKSGISEQLV